MNDLRLLFFASVALVLLGCVQQQQFVCNKPYIQVGSACCLDADNNGVCDSDEGKPLPSQTPSVAPAASPPKPTQPSANLPTPTHAAAPISQGAFVPCKGYQLAGGNGLGPWATRLLTATSDDGLNWTRSNTIIADQADVASAILDDNGTVRVYFVPWCPSEFSRQTVVAMSDDLATWRYAVVSVKGAEQLGYVDPDIVRLDSGKWRLYFTQAPRAGSEMPMTYSAISDDGINFVLEPGVRFQQEGKQVMDPEVLKVGNEWHYFAGSEPSVLGHGGNWHATSEDGLTFVKQDTFMLEGIRMDNGLAVDGGYRFYGFKSSTGATRLAAVFTKDGENWRVDALSELKGEKGGLEYGDYLKEAAPVRLKNGKYLLVYSAETPEFASASGGTSQPSTRPSASVLPLGVTCDGLCDEFERAHPGSPCYASDCAT